MENVWSPTDRRYADPRLYDGTASASMRAFYQAESWRVPNDKENIMSVPKNLEDVFCSKLSRKQNDSKRGEKKDDRKGNGCAKKFFFNAALCAVYIPFAAKSCA